MSQRVDAHRTGLVDLTFLVESSGLFIFSPRVLRGMGVFMEPKGLPGGK